MQKLIDELQKDGFKANHYGDTKTSEILYGIKDYIIENLLEKEKEQIIKAHGIKGWYKPSDKTSGTTTGEEYYNQTYIIQIDKSGEWFAKNADIKIEIAKNK